MLDYDTPYVTINGGGPSSPTPISVTSGNPTAVIDGTPVRVAAIVLAAAAGLWGLRMAGVKFSSTVSVS